jgi:hypothetical protein
VRNVFLFFFFFFFLLVAGDAWHNSSFSDRLPFVLLSGYGVDAIDSISKLEFSKKSGMLGDANLSGSIMTVKYSNVSDESAIRFYYENITDSASSMIVYAEVPIIEQNNSTIVYLYYNNNTPTGSNSTIDIFAASDDFDDADVSDYVVDWGAFLVVDVAQKINYDYSLELANGVSGGLSKDFAASYDLPITFNVRIDSDTGNAGNYAGVFFYELGDSNDFWCSVRLYHNTKKVYSYARGVNTDTGVTWTEGANHNFLCVPDWLTNDYDLFMDGRLIRSNIGMELGPMIDYQFFDSFQIVAAHLPIIFFDNVFFLNWTNATYAIEQPVESIAENIDVFITSPVVNHTYYGGDQVSASFYATAQNTTTFSLYAYLNNVIVYSNTSYINETIIDIILDVVDSSYNFSVYGFKNSATDLQSVFFDSWHGLNISVVSSNSTNLSSHAQIGINNGTGFYFFIDTLLRFSDINLTGNSEINVNGSTYYTVAANQNISLNSSMSVQNLTFILFSKNFFYALNDAGSNFTSFNLSFSYTGVEYLIEEVTNSSLIISSEDLVQGDNSIAAIIWGYANDTEVVTISHSYPSVVVFVLSQALITVNVYNELDLTAVNPVKLVFTNSSNQVKVSNYRYISSYTSGLNNYNYAQDYDLDTAAYVVEAAGGPTLYYITYNFGFTQNLNDICLTFKNDGNDAQDHRERIYIATYNISSLSFESVADTGELSSDSGLRNYCFVVDNSDNNHGDIGQIRLTLSVRRVTSDSYIYIYELYKRSFSESTNFTFFDFNLPIGYDTIQADAYSLQYNSNFVQRNYYLTIQPYSNYSLEYYLIPYGYCNSFTFYVYNFASASIQDAVVTIYKFINEMWRPVEQKLSGPDGAAGVCLDPSTNYRVKIEADGYVNLIFYYQYSSSSSIQVRLTSTGAAGAVSLNYSLASVNVSYQFTPNNYYSAANQTLCFEISDSQSSLEYWGWVLNNVYNNTDYLSDSQLITTVAGGSEICYNTTIDGTFCADAFFKKTGYDEYNISTFCWYIYNETGLVTATANFFAGISCEPYMWLVLLLLLALSAIVFPFVGELGVLFICIFGIGFFAFLYPTCVINGVSMTMLFYLLCILAMCILYFRGVI